MAGSVLCQGIGIIGRMGLIGVNGVIVTVIFRIDALRIIYRLAMASSRWGAGRGCIVRMFQVRDGILRASLSLASFQGSRKCAEFCLSCRKPPPRQERRAGWEMRDKGDMKMEGGVERIKKQTNKFNR